VAFGLPAGVVDTGSAGTELDQPPHYFPRDTAETAEQVEDHAAIVRGRILDIRTLLMVAVAKVALVTSVFLKFAVDSLGWQAVPPRC
jgi:hypothetical protein